MTASFSLRKFFNADLPCQPVGVFLLHPLNSSVCPVCQVLEGKPIYADCFGNLVPLTKSGQHHLFSFFAFKENRLALFIKVGTARSFYASHFSGNDNSLWYTNALFAHNLAWLLQIRDNTQEPCGRLSFMKEPRNYRSLTQNAICNLNITLPSYCKVRALYCCLTHQKNLSVALVSETGC